MSGLGQLPWEHGPLAFIAGETDDLFHIRVLDPVDAARLAMPPLPESTAGNTFIAGM